MRYDEILMIKGDGTPLTFRVSEVGASDSVLTPPAIDLRGKLMCQQLSYVPSLVVQEMLSSEPNSKIYIMNKGMREFNITCACKNQFSFVRSLYTFIRKYGASALYRKEQVIITVGHHLLRGYFRGYTQSLIARLNFHQVNINFIGIDRYNQFNDEEGE